MVEHTRPPRGRTPVAYSSLQETEACWPHGAFGENGASDGTLGGWAEEGEVELGEAMMTCCYWQEEEKGGTDEAICRACKDLAVARDQACRMEPGDEGV